MLADFTVQVDLTDELTLTSISTYIDREIVVSRDASALTGSVSVDLGFPAAAVLLPSNLIDTTDLSTFAQEVRLSTDTEGPFNFVAGIFYANTDRFYRQRLPTPGYDAATDAASAPGRRPRWRTALPPGFALQCGPALRHPADRGVRRGDLRHLRPADRHRRRPLVRLLRGTALLSGSLFSNGDDRTDETSSNGFSPRFILSWEALDNIRFNAQASKGFRLGGVNDPLNLPLCTDQDEAIFGSFQDYDDETLWNYEVGVRGQRRASASAAAFYTDIRNLQVTLDAGSCSSRIVFNAEKRTPWASRPSSPTSRSRASLSRSPAAWSRRSSIRPWSTAPAR